MATRRITAAVPMRMPRIVRLDRNLLARMSRRATRRLSIVTRHLASRWRRHRAANPGLPSPWVVQPIGTRCRASVREAPGDRVEDLLTGGSPAHRLDVGVT